MDKPVLHVALVLFKSHKESTDVFAWKHQEKCHKKGVLDLQIISCHDKSSRPYMPRKTKRDKDSIQNFVCQVLVAGFFTAGPASHHGRRLAGQQAKADDGQ